MPSRFEPCGLNQMYSLRYGTVPVVHGVGGLADTVVDYAPRRTGVDRLRVRRLHAGGAARGAAAGAGASSRTPREWRALQAAGMRQDFSWDRSAREYVKIYERAMQQGCGRGRAQGLRD